MTHEQLDHVTMDATQSYADTAIAQGSQSFAAASKLFDEQTRRDVAKLYAWCRYCDDIVDGQVLGHGSVQSDQTPQQRLAALEAATIQALAPNGRPDHPAFLGLREIAERYSLPTSLPLAHLEGFRADVENRSYETLQDLLGYCYGVAGVVGVMMTHVMGVRNRQVLDRACDLGLAFQLTNIARDIVEDAANNRIYVPVGWLREAGLTAQDFALPDNRQKLAGIAARLVEAAEPYYASARIGLAGLPWRAAWAIAAALNVYREIGQEVVRRGAGAWDARVTTSRKQKIGYAALGTLAATRSRLPSNAPPRNPAMWQRPDL